MGFIRYDPEKTYNYARDRALKLNEKKDLGIRCSEYLRVGRFSVVVAIELEAARCA